MGATVGQWQGLESDLDTDIHQRLNQHRNSRPPGFLLHENHKPLCVLLMPCQHFSYLQLFLLLFWHPALCIPEWQVRKTCVKIFVIFFHPHVEHAMLSIGEGLWYFPAWATVPGFPWVARLCRPVRCPALVGHKLIHCEKLGTECACRVLPSPGDADAIESLPVLRAGLLGSGCPQSPCQLQGVWFGALPELQELFS